MDLNAVVLFGNSGFEVGQTCIFHNRHSSGLLRFDNKACRVIDILPQQFWLENDMPEYRVQFIGDNGPLNKVRVEENELEPLPN